MLPEQNEKATVYNTQRRSKDLKNQVNKLQR